MNLQPQDTIERFILEYISKELPISAVVFPAQNRVLFIGTPFECSIFYEGAKLFCGDEHIYIVELSISR